jgi:ribosomal protein S18 acetylase RimI-like enzyme
MSKRHAPKVAALHMTILNKGFLTRLGEGFLRQLYKAIPACPSGFGYVCEQPDGTVLGFIACAESTGRLYKQSLLRRGLMMIFAALRHIVRPSVIKGVISNLLYPSELGQDVPPAELLSVAVSRDAQGKGVGKALMAAAVEEFRRRSIRRIRVAVWTYNEQAIGYYRRFGFELALQREHHGDPMDVYVLDLDEQT